MSRTDLKVAQSAIRCPFCHGDIQVASRDWVVCRSCVARHHAACWEERRACSACGERAHLVDAAPRSGYASDVKRLAVEAEIARLDREWQAERVLHLLRTKQGELLEPSSFEPVGFGVFTALGLVFAMMTLAAGGPSPFPIVGVVVAVFCCFQAVAAEGRLKGYREAIARYEARRRELLVELDAARRAF